MEVDDFMKSRLSRKPSGQHQTPPTNRAPSADLFHLAPHLTRAFGHVFGSGRPSKRAAGRQAGGTQGDSGEALRSRRGGEKLSLKLKLCFVRPNLHFFHEDLDKNRCTSRTGCKLQPLKPTSDICVSSC